MFGNRVSFNIPKNGDLLNDSFIIRLPGIQRTSFALYPENYQPSGHVNYSMAGSFDFLFKSSPLDKFKQCYNDPKYYQKIIQLQINPIYPILNKKITKLPLDIIIKYLSKKILNDLNKMSSALSFISSSPNSDSEINFRNIIKLIKERKKQRILKQILNKIYPIHITNIIHKYYKKNNIFDLIFSPF